MNYSPPAATLLQSGRIAIDRFKTPDWPGMIAEASPLCPVAIHFNLHAGHARPPSIDWDRLERLMDATGTPYLNLHLDASLEEFPHLPVEVPDPVQFEAVVQSILADVRAAVARFGPQRVIVENIHYRAGLGKILRPSVEPAVIRRVIDETGCGLLLDISHARIAAHYLGLDERAYIAALPLERLRELHFTGLHTLDDVLEDHLPILESDWPILDWALAHIRAGGWPRPWLLAFEYGGIGPAFAWRSDPQVIAEQVPRLYELVHEI
ncbi:MAG: DUF692 family multinuclear iron-containing protein [Chloroflexota bacterium]